MSVLPHGDVCGPEEQTFQEVTIRVPDETFAGEAVLAPIAEEEQNPRDLFTLSSEEGIQVGPVPQWGHAYRLVHPLELDGGASDLAKAEPVELVCQSGEIGGLVGLAIRGGKALIPDVF